MFEKPEKNQEPLLMNVLLLLPFDPCFDIDIPDLGLGYLASYLKQEGHEVKILVRPQELNSATALADFLKKQPFDIIGIKCMSSSIFAIMETIRLIRQVDHNIKIVLGGAHPSCDPENIFGLLPEADFAFRGEAEIGLAQLAKTLETGDLSPEILKTIPGLIWKDGQKTTANELAIIEDIDSLAFPAWELMKPRNFPHIPFHGYSRRYPIAPMLLTRGCPGKCTYCSADKLNRRKVRSRSVDSIMDEMNLLVGKYGVREIEFFDSNCASPNGPLRQVCEQMVSQKLDVTWCAPVGMRVDSIDKELAGLMRQSGCFQVHVGIESGSPRVLKMVKKGITPDLVREKVRIIRDAGIEVVGYFIIGFPTETKKEIETTLSFAMELPLTGASFSIFNPLPGTPIFEEVYGNQQVDAQTLQSLDYIHYENNLSEIPFEGLRRTQKNAYLKFYLRPRILKYFFRNINSLRKTQFILHRIIKLLF